MVDSIVTDVHFTHFKGLEKTGCGTYILFMEIDVKDS